MTHGAAKERLRPFKPQRFGRYDLLMPLSTGGMGEIFLARLAGAQGFEKLCVIKKILPHLAEDKEFVERFVDEARILVKLSHGNIAQVLDMGLHEGAPYIALEFIDGKDLRRVVARAVERGLQLPLSFLLYVTTRVLDALAYAHRKRGADGKELNLVHRDVSPQNVLISYEGEVKIIDFGLAKSALSSARTHPSIVLGKFLYMSPEQARHQKVDRRSDLYAVGLCLYELIAGKGPFSEVPPGELMVAVGNPQIPPLSSIEPLCPPTLSDAVMKALAPDPAQRFQTADEMRAKLLALLLEIDPSAGPETASRFMAEAFAGEFQAERKLLTELSEQARALAPDQADDDEDASAKRTVTRDASDAMPALTLDDLSAAAVTTEVARLERESASAEALSFQPTRKGTPPVERAAAAAVSPAVPTPAAPTPGVVTATVPSLLAPTELMESNVVLDQALLEAAEAEARQRQDARNAKLAKKGKPNAAKISKPPAATKPEVPRRLPTRADTTPMQVTLPVTQQPTVQQPRVAPRMNLVWVALPVIAVIVVVGYILWDRAAEQDRARRAVEELAGPAVKIVPPKPKETPKEVADVVERPKGTPGERALTTLKGDLKQVADEALARKFSVTLRSLEERVQEHGQEAAFLAEVNQLHAQVRDALAQQQ